MKVPDKKRSEGISTAAHPERGRYVPLARRSSGWVESVPTKPFTYPDADWQKIEASLRVVGIDADVEMVSDHWWTWLDPKTALTTAPQRPLREQLQELAAEYYGRAVYRKQSHSLTPRQEAAEMQEALNWLEPVRAGFALESISKPARAAFDPRLLHFIRETTVACEVLTVIITKLKRRVAKLRAEDSRSPFNARKTHIEYWGRLVLLWQAITADQNLQRKRGLNSFLIACSTPVYPEETSKSNINNFRRNYIKRPAEKGPVLPS